MDSDLYGRLYAGKFTTTEIPKGSPLWQGVQGDRVPLLKFPVITLKLMSTPLP